MSRFTVPKTSLSVRAFPPKLGGGWSSTLPCTVNTATTSSVTCPHEWRHVSLKSRSTGLWKKTGL